VISAAQLHFGEEPCLVGKGGSGTIFLTGCNLSCLFCQNSDISHHDTGRTVTRQQFIQLALGLQEQGAENINLVTPTHQAPQLFEAVREARSSGLRVPVVYNCGGYENPAFLEELDGLVDIYMPDFKYGTDEAAARLSGAADYVRWCTLSLREMHRQVGDLRSGARGTAERGLLVRHLVLPGGLAGSRQVIDFLSDHISRDTVLNIMDQYHPAYRARELHELSRRPLRSEVDAVAAYAAARGMRRTLR
jgi:putative pyruvate formate lyase activating enzyme